MRLKRRQAEEDVPTSFDAIERPAIQSWFFAPSTCPEGQIPLEF